MYIYEYFFVLVVFEVECFLKKWNELSISLFLKLLINNDQKKVDTVFTLN